MAIRKARLLATLGLILPSVAYAQDKYLILAADSQANADAIQASLLGAGLTNVDVLAGNGLATPTLQDLLAYDAVLTYSNQSYASGEAMGNVLADYVDAGGGVVLAVYAVSTLTANRSLTGRWETGGYDIIPARSGNLTAAAALGTVQDPNHPIWGGTVSFVGATNYARATTTNVSSHGIRVADWDSGQALIATSAQFPSRVDLNFYPVAWHTTADGARILANALIYAGNAPAPAPAGCCFADGTCQVLLPLDCINQGGVFKGIGSDCTSPCPQPGACCFADGTCTYVLEADCVAAGGNYSGANVTCAAANCPQPGACCLPSGCFIFQEAQCTALNGTFKGGGTDCATAGCPAPTVGNVIGFNMTTASSTTPDPQNWNRVSAATGSLTDVNDDKGLPTTVDIAWSGASGGFSFLSSSTLAPDAVPQYTYDLSGMTGYGFRSSAAQFTIELTGLTPNATYEYWFVGYRSTSIIDQTINVSEGDTLNAITFVQNLPSASNNGRFMVNEVNADSTMHWDTLSKTTTASSTGTMTINWNGNGTNTSVIGALAIRENFSTPPACYANCDGSTGSPVLNTADFGCFLTKFAAGDPYANCDGSTGNPTLNVADFGCFLSKFAAGCN